MVKITNSTFSIHWIVLVFVVVQIASINSNPLHNDTICGYPYCKVPSKFKYEVGTTYKYHYQSDVITSLHGNNTEESRIHFSATARIHFLSPCEASLQLSDVSLQESNPKDSNDTLPVPQEEEYRKALEQYTIRFEYVNGRIPEVCADVDEPTWVLNVKKGLLSAIVNSMPRLDLSHETDESDVRGICKTNYKLSNVSDSSLIISKKISFDKCIYRYGSSSTIQSVPYYFPAGPQSLPLVNSTSECTQVVNRNLITNVECTEKHVLRPFSEGTQGVTTSIRQVLELREETEEEERTRDIIHRRTTLLYDHAKYDFTDPSDTDEATATLRKLCTATSDSSGLHMDSPGLYRKLIEDLRRFSSSDLGIFYGKMVNACADSRDLLLDILPSLQTSSAVSLMKDYILGMAVSNERADYWLLAISFYQRTNVEMLSAVMPLLKMESPSHQVPLSIASLLHTYCLSNPYCYEEKIVRELQSLILNGIEENCVPDTRVHREQMLVTLKSIGNLGLSNPTVLEALHGCLASVESGVQVRVTTLEAFRRLPCGYDTEAIWDIFRDDMEDSELRISAFLALMRCPNYNTILSVIEDLRNEEVNQVGSFVLSYFRNLQDTSLPSRADIQGLFSGQNLINEKFQTDFRKFSRYYETSFFNDQANIGAGMESNILFSTNSYIPRSAMLNLTLDVYGASINLFEMNLRAEGWENYFESLFGPSGKLQQENIHSILKLLRSKRGSSATKGRLDDIRSVYSADERFYTDPLATMSTKIFGNEVKFAHYEGESEVKDFVNSLHPVKYLSKLLSEKGLKFEKSVMFLDASYTIPTSAGFPLHLASQGSALIHFHMRGNAKIADFMKSRNLELDGKLEPSAAVEITGSMGVDAVFAKSEAKMKLQAHTSASIQGKAEVKGSRLIHVEFGIPTNKVELLNVETELVLSHNGREYHPENKVEDQQSTCTWTWLQKSTGLRFCANVTKSISTDHGATSLDFPLNTPSSVFKLSLEKADDGINKYIVDYRNEDKKDRDIITAVIAAESTNSRKEVSVRFTSSKTSPDYGLLVNLPNDKLEIKGKLKNEDISDTSIDLALTWNDKDQFLFEAGVRNTVQGSTTTITPSADLDVLGERVAELRGDIRFTSKKGVNQYDAKVELAWTNVLQAKLTGTGQYGDKLYTTRLQLDYQADGRKKELVSIDAKFSDQSTQSKTQIHTNIAVNLSQAPKWNATCSWKLQHTESHLENLLEFTFQPSGKTTLFQLFTYRTTYEGVLLNMQLQATQPSSRTDYLLALRHHATGSELTNTVTIRLAPEMEVKNEIELIKGVGNMYDVTGSWNLSLPGIYPFRIKCAAKEESVGNFKVSVSGTWITSDEFDAVVIYRDSSNQIKLDYELDANFTSTHLKGITAHGRLIKEDYSFHMKGEAFVKGILYSGTVNYNLPSYEPWTADVEFKNGSYVYSASAKIDLTKNIAIEMDIHLDAFRDLSLKVRASAGAKKRMALLELKWDANRDPSEKLFIEVLIDQPQEVVYMVSFSVIVPEKTLKGSASGGYTADGVEGALKLDWALGKSLEIIFKGGLLDQMTQAKGISLEVNTPLELYKKNYFIAKVEFPKGMILTVDSKFKVQEYLRIDAQVDYIYRASFLELWANGTLLSSFQRMENITTIFHHMHQNTDMETTVVTTTSTGDTTKIKSIWQYKLGGGSIETNGIITAETPWEGYTDSKFVMRARVQGMDKRPFFQIDGEAMKESKLYNFTVTGPLLVTTLGQWNFEAKTPVIGYETISSVLHYESKGHLKQFIQFEAHWPKDSLELNVAVDINSRKDFHIELVWKSPFKVAPQLHILAVIQKKTIEFKVDSRGGQALGVLLAWRLNSLKDMRIGAGLQTPSVMLSDIGAEVHIETTDGLIVYTGGRYNQQKLGLRLKSSRFVDDPLKWNGLMVLDTLKYPTVSVEVHIKQEANVIFTTIVVLPATNQPINLKNRFQLVDVLNFNNEMQVTTLYDGYNKFNIKFDLDTKLEVEKYTFSINTKWSTGVDELEKVNVKVWFIKSMKKEIGIMLDSSLKYIEGLEIIISKEDLFYKLEAMLLEYGNNNTLEAEYYKADDNTEKYTYLQVHLPIINFMNSTFKVKTLSDINGSKSIITVTTNNSIPMFDQDIVPHQHMYNLSVLWKKKENSISLHANLTTPMENFEFCNAILTITKNTTSNKRYLLDFRVTRPKETIISSKADVSKNYIHFSLQTLYQRIRNIEVTLHYQQKSAILSTGNATVSWNRKTIYADMTLEINRSAKNDQDHKLLINVVTPFPEVQSIKVSIKFPSIPNGFESISTIEWGNKKLEAQIGIKENDLVWNVYSKIQTPFKDFEDINMDIIFYISKKSIANLEIKLQTPHPDYNNYDINVTYSIGNVFEYYLDTVYKTPTITGTFNSAFGYQKSELLLIKLKTKYKENMEIDEEEIDSEEGEMEEEQWEGCAIHVYYNLPKKEHFDFNGKLEFFMENPRLLVGGNSTVQFIKSEILNVELNLDIPIPEPEVYSLQATITGEGTHTFTNTLAYRTQMSDSNYYSFLKAKYDFQEIVALSRVEWSRNVLDRVENQLEINYKSPKSFASYTLHTPLYEEKTAAVKGNHELVNERHKVEFDFEYPENIYTLDGDVAFNGFPTSNGLINVTTPFDAIKTGSVNYTSELLNKRYVGKYYFKWLNKTANFLIDNAINYGLGFTMVTGKIETSLPIDVAQNTSIVYSYKGKETEKDAELYVESNLVRLLTSKYNYNFYIDDTKSTGLANLEVDNHFLPAGLEFTSKYDYTTEKVLKQQVYSVDLFHLKFRNEKKIETLVVIDLHPHGKDIKTTVTTPNRTVELFTTYEKQDNYIRHNTKLTLKDGVWVGYEIEGSKVISIDKFQYDGLLRFSYPSRSLALSGHIKKQGLSIWSEGNFNWDENSSDKNVALIFELDHADQVNSVSSERASLRIKHPLLEKDIKFVAELLSNRRETHGIKMVMEYSSDLKRKVVAFIKTSWEPRELAEFKHWFEIRLHHPVTKLDMKMTQIVDMGPTGLRCKNEFIYKRGEEINNSSELLCVVSLADARAILQLVDASGRQILEGEVQGFFPAYTLVGSLKDNNRTKGSAVINMDFEKPLGKLVVNYNTERDESFTMEGGSIDTRYIFLNIVERQNRSEISHVGFHARINNTHLFTSKAIWRRELPDEFVTVMYMTQDEFYKLMNRTEKWWFDNVEEGKIISLLVWDDMKQTITPFINSLSEIKHLHEDYDVFKAFVTKMYEENEFYLEDIHAYIVLAIEEISVRSNKVFKNIVDELRTMSGSAASYIIKLVGLSIKQLVYLWNHVVSVMKGDKPSAILAFIEDALVDVLDAIVETSKRFQNFVTRTWRYYSNIVYTHIHEKFLHFVETWKPMIMAYYHKIETAMWNVIKSISSFLYETSDEVTKSKIYQQLQSLARDVDQLYKDLTQNDAPTNIRKYYTILRNFVREKYENIARYRDYFGDFGKFAEEKWTEFVKYPGVGIVLEYLQIGYTNMAWFYDYLDIDGKIKDILITVYTNGRHIATQTSIQAIERNTIPKTKFIYDPPNGIVDWEQKLPFPWFALNEKPLYEEIPEYNEIKRIQSYLEPSESSVLDHYYKLKPYMDLEHWLPPFPGQAFLLGVNHIRTFDGATYVVNGSCSYVLASDFVNDNFTFILQQDKKPDGTVTPKIHIYSDNDEITLNVLTGSIFNKKDVVRFPAQFNSLFAYQEGNMVALESPKGFAIRCNTNYHICQFELSGWYFGKTGGLLGTLDNEVSSDFITPERRRANYNKQDFISTWIVDNSCSEQIPVEDNMITGDISSNSICNRAFRSSDSNLRPCFPIVDPEPFYKMCIMSVLVKDRSFCSSAVGYITACQAQGIPVRIPTSCVGCVMSDGKEVPEGAVVRMEANTGRISSDVVFIIEAKECNKELGVKKKLPDLVEALNKELSEKKIIMNRYAVVIFGGDGVYDKPRATTVRKEVFTSAKEVVEYMNNIPAGNGSNDIFEALMFAATTLSFRQGSSKTFILLPCSNCSPSAMNMEYSVVLQALLERDITLHVLMNSDFTFDKPREAKVFFGMDGSTGFTKRDWKGRLQGDTDLRRQVQLPKSILGYCAPLAMETNGTVFAGRKLETKKTLLKKFVTVFGKRASQTAVPSPCEVCECISDNEGASKMECFPCTYPQPAHIQYRFEEEFPSIGSSRIGHGKSNNYDDEDEEEE